VFVKIQLFRFYVSSSFFFRRNKHIQHSFFFEAKFRVREKKKHFVELRWRFLCHSSFSDIKKCKRELELPYRLLRMYSTHILVLNNLLRVLTKFILSKKTFSWKRRELHDFKVPMTRRFVKRSNLCFTFFVIMNWDATNLLLFHRVEFCLLVLLLKSFVFVALNLIG
jgi:hypothetical protein